MTVDCTSPRPIVDISQTTLYPAKVLFRHPQLRSLLCSPEAGILIYPFVRNIFVLDTVSRTRECIASLPFSPRCINAKYGWICAGGKTNGQFAAMKVGNYRESMKSSRRRRTANKDEEGESDRDDDGMDQDLYISSEYGGNICNSVTMHKFQSMKGCSKSDTVYAVLTNNDHTVRIVDLEHNIVVRTLEFDEPTNHASISPDGRFLVVVGDMRDVFFYEIDTPEGFLYERTGLIPIPPFTVGLNVARPAHISTSFSPCSRFCAVASQDGGVFIFDTQLLWGGSRAMIKEVRSPRSGSVEGALRSVQFSTAPWDMMVWAENSGRVSISDARCDFGVRQTIEVVVEGDEIVRAEITGVTEEEALEKYRRVLHRQREERVLLARYSLHGLEHGLQADESLSARLDAYDAQLYDTYYRPPGASTRERLRTYEALRSGTEGVMLPPALPSSTASSTTAPATQPRLSSHSSYRNMLQDRRPHDPTNDLRARLQQHQLSSYLTPVLSSSYVTPPPAPSAPHSAAVSRQPSRQPSSTTLRQGAGQEDGGQPRRRAHIQRISSSRRGTVDPDRALLMQHYMSESSNEVGITGCTMSGDGRKLYVATQEGILEYPINLKTRMEHPKVEYR